MLDILYTMDTISLKDNALGLISQILEDIRPGEDIESLLLGQTKLQRLDVSFQPVVICILNQLIRHLRSYSHERQKFDTHIRPRDGAIIHPQSIYIDEESSSLAAEVLVFVEDLEELLGVRKSYWQVVCRRKRFHNRDKRREEEEAAQSDTDHESEAEVI